MRSASARSCSGAPVQSAATPARPRVHEDVWYRTPSPRVRIGPQEARRTPWTARPSPLRLGLPARCHLMERRTVLTEPPNDAPNSRRVTHTGKVLIHLAHTACRPSHTATIPPNLPPAKEAPSCPFRASRSAILHAESPASGAPSEPPFSAPKIALRCGARSRHPGRQKGGRFGESPAERHPSAQDIVSWCRRDVIHPAPHQLSSYTRDLSLGSCNNTRSILRARLLHRGPLEGAPRYDRGRVIARCSPRIDLQPAGGDHLMR